ncbi:glycosyltransferase family 2 protein [Acidobacteriota bacterium]
MKHGNQPSEHPEVSVIICTFNSESRLPGCLDSLFAQEFTDFELIVIDDGSTDRTPALLKNLEPSCPVPFRHLYQDRLGPAAGRNLGVLSAEGRYVVFTDDDVTFDKKWLGALVRNLEEHPDSQGVEGKTIPNQYPDGLYHLNLDNQKGGLYLTCNIAYRKQAFDEIGGFDETFRFPCREDSDLAFRILDSGGSIGFEPKAIAFHTYYKISVWLPLKIARTLDHSVYLHDKHPKRFSLHPLLYPSYILAVLSFLLAGGAFAGGSLWAGFGCLAVFAALVARNMGQDIRWKGVRKISTFLGIKLVYAILPFVYLFYLVKALIRKACGKCPIASRHLGQPRDN